VRYCAFFFQAEDGIRDRNVTGVLTCALPIYTLDDIEVPEVPQVDLTEYATKKYVEDTLDGIEAPDIDLTEYAKIEDLPEFYESRFNPILEIEEFFKIDRSSARFYGVKNLKDGKKMSDVSSIYINHLL